MKYLLLFGYIVLFGTLPELIGYDYDVAFLGSLISAIGAGKDAKRMQRRADALNPIRPEYDIPAEVRMYLENAQNMAQGDAPGYARALDQAYATTAGTVDASRNVGSGSALLQSVAQGGVNQQRNINDINLQNQQFRQSQFGSFQDALMKMAGYQDQAFDINEMQPYLQEESDKRQYQQAAWEQKQAARDSWAAFGDGLIGTATAALGAPTGASGQSMFAKLFQGKQDQGRQVTQAIQAPNKPSVTRAPVFDVPKVDIYR